MLYFGPPTPANDLQSSWSITPQMDLPDTYQGQYRGSDAGPLYAAQAEVLVKAIQDKANGVKVGVSPDWVLTG